MDVRHLRQILAIRQHGSLAKAADALGLSQPSLSKSISRLEDELRVTLFRRTAAGSELTPLGEMVADRAKHVIAATNDLMRETALLAQGEGGLVRIGAGPPLRNSFLPRLLVTLAVQHPRLDIQIEVDAGERLLQRLLSRDIDIAFCALRGDVSAGDFRFEAFLDGEVICVAAPSHPLAGRTEIPQDELIRFPTCGVRSQFFGNQALLGVDADETGVTAYTTNDYEATIPMVAATQTILVGTSFSLEPHLRSGAVVRLDVGDVAIVPFVAVTLPSSSFSPILRKVTGYAMEIGDTMTREWRELAATA